jgi:hypothetical protein
MRKPSRSRAEILERIASHKKTPEKMTISGPKVGSLAPKPTYVYRKDAFKKTKIT